MRGFRRLEWTPEMDAYITEERAGGATWKAIALFLGMSNYAARERGRFIKAELGVVRKLTRELPTGREAMPPGHPVSWGAITIGTLLEGQEYRYEAPKFHGKPAAVRLVEMAMREAA